jgi:hypothetical protein
MSSGDRVPEVITTLWKRSKTGFIAIAASLQQSWEAMGYDGLCNALWARKNGVWE